MLLLNLPRQNELSLQQQHSKGKQLENQLEHMKTVLSMESEKVNLELDQDLKTLYSSFNQKKYSRLHETILE